VDIGYRRLAASDDEALVHFLCGEAWPFHGAGAVDPDTVRQRVADGFYEDDEHRTFWITEGDDRIGLIRLMDLNDDTPMFDLRVRGDCRGRGIGVRALGWLTGYLFDEFPDVRRIEGTTRQDNHAMRRAFRRCRYVKEAHYRDAWPGPARAVYDAVGYAVLRRDWEAGTVTLPEWDDE
jgi:RimJ/RimL family protein N-acetyltransferase